MSLLYLNTINKLAIKHKVLPANKVHTIHNGVHDLPVNKKFFYSVAEETPTIIMVARFSPPKKQLQLLKALNQIRHIQWKMYFAGEGPASRSQRICEREKSK